MLSADSITDIFLSHNLAHPCIINCAIIRTDQIIVKVTSENN